MVSMAFLRCRFSGPLFIALVECVKMAAKSLTVGVMQTMRISVQCDKNAICDRHEANSITMFFLEIVTLR